MIRISASLSGKTSVTQLVMSSLHRLNAALVSGVQGMGRVSLFSTSESSSLSGSCLTAAWSVKLKVYHAQEPA